MRVVKVALPQKKFPTPLDLHLAYIKLTFPVRETMP